MLSNKYSPTNAHQQILSNKCSPTNALYRMLSIESSLSNEYSLLHCCLKLVGSQSRCTSGHRVCAATHWEIGSAHWQSAPDTSSSLTITSLTTSPYCCCCCCCRCRLRLVGGLVGGQGIAHQTATTPQKVSLTHCQSDHDTNSFPAIILFLIQLSIAARVSGVNYFVCLFVRW